MHINPPDNAPLMHKFAVYSGYTRVIYTCARRRAKWQMVHARNEKSRNFSFCRVIANKGERRALGVYLVIR